MPDLPDLPRTEAAIVERTNVFRTANALSTLVADARLTAAARGFARYLASAPVFSHEADGRRPQDRIKATGYEACLTAENLAWMLDSRGFTTADLASRMVEGWKASPGHRKNLLTQHATETGVAVVQVRGQQKYMSVQLFARPKRLQYQFEVVNTSTRKVAYTFAGKPVATEPRMVVRHTACIPGTVAFDTGRGKQAFVVAESVRFTLSNGPGGRLQVVRTVLSGGR